MLTSTIVVNKYNLFKICRSKAILINKDVIAKYVPIAAICCNLNNNADKAVST